MMIHGPKAQRQQEDDGAFLPQGDRIDVYRYVQIVHRREAVEPEKKLMLAILEDALVSLKKSVHGKGGRGQRWFCEAEEWLLSDTEEWIFSFRNVCEALGISPSYLRERTLRWREAQLAVRSNAGNFKDRFGRGPQRWRGHRQRLWDNGRIRRSRLQR